MRRRPSPCSTGAYFCGLPLELQQDGLILSCMTSMVFLLAFSESSTERTRLLHNPVKAQSGDPAAAGFLPPRRRRRRAPSRSGPTWPQSATTWWRPTSGGSRFYVRSGARSWRSRTRGWATTGALRFRHLPACVPCNNLRDGKVRKWTLCSLSPGQCTVNHSACLHNACHSLLLCLFMQAPPLRLERGSSEGCSCAEAQPCHSRHHMPAVPARTCALERCMLGAGFVT